MGNLKHAFEDKMEDMNTVIHRFEYMAVYRVKNRNAIKKSISIQDKIRGKTTGKFSGTKEIRKWREEKCS